jgi:hypothetical protein
VFVDVEPFWQFIAVGTVIIVSVLVDRPSAYGRAPLVKHADPLSRNVSKHFGVQALDRSADVFPGEIMHLSDNRAGKSTIKAISGIFGYEVGDILLDGVYRLRHAAGGTHTASRRSIRTGARRQFVISANISSAANR